MTIQLTLPAELEERLRREAERQQVPVDAVTVRLLDKHLPALDRRAAAIAMLEQWIAEDDAMTPEDGAANATVLRAIDADRLSDRKLFANLLHDKPA